MKTYIAEKGKTFVDKNGVNHGTIVQTNNIESLTQIDIETKIPTHKELSDIRKAQRAEIERINQEYQELNQ